MKLPATKEDRIKCRKYKKTKKDSHKYEREDLKDLSSNIHSYNEVYKEQIIAVWEKSVRTTHTFLAPADIAYYKKIIENMDFNAIRMFCLIDKNTVIGFIGLDKTKIEMLFLAPEHIGKGSGKKLIEFAFSNFSADKVDVNEQNANAVEFYKKFGFEIFERTEKDDFGKDYPILKMRRINDNKIGNKDEK
ncbi:MAG: GNAT family N-acetyltransferase [Tannerellaceae bacterium]|jgi:putative acetyltransferase|nr:GNAT family N-acetyltransferase [Tannerellaceae bacterium]